MDTMLYISDVIMNPTEAFPKKVKDSLEEIGYAYFTFDDREWWMFEELFTRVEDYAIEHELFNTLIALYAVRGIYSGNYTAEYIERDGESYHVPYVSHCLDVCKLLMDLRIPISHYELDIVLAAALCHGLIANIFFSERGREMVTIYHLDSRIYEIMQLVTKKRYRAEKDRVKFFDELQQDCLALLVRLSDRANYVEKLYNIPIWRAREYIHETRTYYFPMCFYAKENYPELAAIFSIFLEKMRTLLEVTEIMVGRFEQREIELSNEILALKEENARIRGIIKQKKK